MIPTVLQHLLAAHGIVTSDPIGAEATRALEAAADASPGDAVLRELLAFAHGGASAANGLPPVMCGVRRERLVRWDAISTTWLGTDARTGSRVMLRVLRPWAARDPMLRRMMERDARALAPVVAGLHVDPETCGLTAPLPGPEAQPAAAGGHVGLVARTLQGMLAWEQAGLGLDPIAPEELCDAGDHLRVLTLTPLGPSLHARSSDAGGVLRRVADLVRQWWNDAADHPLADLVSALVAMPPRTVQEAAESCRVALASALAAERHRITRRERALRQRDERARLGALLDRMLAALPPPRGRAAVGVDLAGRTLVVQNYDNVVMWGPSGERPEIIWSKADGMDAALARRLLRARGSAPVSERLNREVEGNVQYVDRITRWLAAALELRTLRMLLADPATRSQG
jgi:hypothetical protein